MLRNKEFAVLFLSLTAISAVGVAVLFSESALAAGIGAFFFLLLLITVLLITRGRYKKIQALSDTLRRVNRGDYSLHPEEGQEGELSILQSEIYKTVLMLKQQNELLEKDKSFLADSLSDISHQLKTPLTSMFVMTDLLCDSKLSDEKRTEFTDNIRQQLQRMQWLIESLLKLSKLDAKTISFHIRGTTPKMLVDKALAPLLIPAELKNVTFEFSSDEKPFSCDINWTVEALVNILKNCLEHTPANGIIKISCQTTPLFTRIMIEDNGKGIDHEDLPHIFERFYKGKNAAADGIGIGLAMAKTIAEAQGGSLTAANAPGGGAQFTFLLPRMA